MHQPYKDITCICSECEVSFIPQHYPWLYLEGKRQTIFCSSKCGSRYHSRKIYQRKREAIPKVDYTCIGCGCTFTRQKSKPYKKTPDYCTTKCRQTNYVRKEYVDRYAHLYVEVECSNCNTSLKRRKKTTQFKDFYCNIKCRQEHRRKSSYKNRPFDVLTRECKQSARHRNLSFSLPNDYIEMLYNRQGGICALSGVRMTFNGEDDSSIANISIDRIDSALGYIEGNVQLVCRCVNYLKRGWDNSIIQKLLELV